MLGIGGIVLVSYAFSHPDVLYFSEIAVDSANQTLDVFYFFENSGIILLLNSGALREGVWGVKTPLLIPNLCF